MFYIYDNITNEFIGETPGSFNPLEGGVIQPAFTTDIRPPVFTTDQKAIFNGDGWDIINLVEPEPEIVEPEIVIEPDPVVVPEPYVEGTPLPAQHPTISLIGEADSEIYVGDTYVELGAIAHSISGEDISDEVTTQGSIDTSIELYQEILYTIVSEGIPESVLRGVNVVKVLPSTEPPIITLLGDEHVHIPALTGYVEDGFIVVDNQDGVITDSTNVIYDNYDEPGNYSITYTATDSNNNTVSKTRQITVADYTPEQQLGVDTDIWKSQRAALVDDIEVTYNLNVYQGDEISQARMSRTINALPDDTTTIPWTAKDNTVHNLTRLELQTILLDAGTQQSYLWNAGRPTL